MSFPAEYSTNMAGNWAGSCLVNDMEGGGALAGGQKQRPGLVCRAVFG